MMFLLTFASKAAAVEFYDSDVYAKYMRTFGVGTSLLREVRLFGAPADLFQRGKVS